MPADDTQSSSWGSSQRPASHLRTSLAAAGRRSTRQTRLRTSEWMHQGGTMARHQVHRCRWLACRRRSAAPPITISRLSRGKTVEKCTGSRPARKSKSPERGLRVPARRVDASPGPPVARNKAFSFLVTIFSCHNVDDYLLEQRFRQLARRRRFSRDWRAALSSHPKDPFSPLVGLPRRDLRSP